jgi:hypothetical protein
MLVKRCVPLAERIEQTFVGRDGDIGGLLEPIDPAIVDIEIFDRQGLIRPPRRIQPGASPRPGRVLGVMFQRIGGVIGRAHHDHAEMAEEALRSKRVVLEARVGASVDGFCALAVQELADPEGFTKLHVRPVVERIAHGFGHRLRPRFELFPVVGVAGAVALAHPVGPHRPPFVVIAVQPQFREGAKPVVFRDLLRRQMGVIIDDRKALREPMVKVAGDLRFEEKVFVQEGRHGH